MRLSELLSVGAMYHGVSPTEHYRRTDERFEVDGADLAQNFPLDHGLSADESHQIGM